MNKHCSLPIIYIGNSVCQFFEEVKYLGVIIHSIILFYGNYYYIYNSKITI